MSKLKSNFENYLPLNRKERYYTGTVLPQIICFDNFKHIHRFLNLIIGFPKNLDIKPNASINNIQFLSEYSLKESANFDTNSVKFANVPETKETPDIVILISEPEPYLVLIEVKMYSGINHSDFIKQLSDQRKMVNCIKDNLNIPDNNIFHLGLVPQKMFGSTTSNEFQVLYFEDILSVYKDILEDNYFYNVLQLAIDKYPVLKSNSTGSSYGKNMECKLTGLQIIEEVKSGKKFIIGRNRGINGPELVKDIETGGWKSFSYEVNFSETNPINRNWFTSGQFYSRVTNKTHDFMSSKIISNKIEKPKMEADNYDSSDKWHFKYLGKNYFENIAGKVCNKYSLDVPIKTVYVGKSGEPYKLNLQNRNINPNWWVVLENDKKFRRKQNTKNEFEEGEYNSSNGNRFEWKSIKEYFDSNKDIFTVY